MKRIKRYAVAVSTVLIFAGSGLARAATLSHEQGGQSGTFLKMAKSAEPRIMEVEEEVWLSKNQEVQLLRDELLKVSAALKITEAENERLEKELITVKKGIQGKDVKSHKVEDGENLWKIAQKYYKDPYKWLWLFKANIEQIEDPDNLYPEQVIDIPRY